jgi:hypothetical protein
MGPDHTPLFAYPLGGEIGRRQIAHAACQCRSTIPRLLDHNLHLLRLLAEVS